MTIDVERTSHHPVPTQRGSFPRSDRSAATLLRPWSTEGIEPVGPPLFGGVWSLLQVLEHLGAQIMPSPRRRGDPPAFKRRPHAGRVPFETSNTCDPERSRLAGRATLCAPASRESGAIQTSLARSVDNLEPCRDRTCRAELHVGDRLAGGSDRDGQLGGGVHSLIAVTVAKKMARAMSAMPHATQHHLEPRASSLSWRMVLG